MKLTPVTTPRAYNGEAGKALPHPSEITSTSFAHSCLCVHLVGKCRSDHCLALLHSDGLHWNRPRPPHLWKILRGGYFANLGLPPVVEEGIPRSRSLVYNIRLRAIACHCHPSISVGASQPTQNNDVQHRSKIITHSSRNLLPCDFSLQANSPSRS